MAFNISQPSRTKAWTKLSHFLLDVFYFDINIAATYHTNMHAYIIIIDITSIKSFVQIQSTIMGIWYMSEVHMVQLNFNSNFCHKNDSTTCTWSLILYMWLLLFPCLLLLHQSSKSPCTQTSHGLDNRVLITSILQQEYIDNT